MADAADELLQRLADELAARDHDLGSLAGNRAQRVFGDLGPDEPRTLDEHLDARSHRDLVSALQHQIVRRSELLSRRARP